MRREYCEKDGYLITYTDDDVCFEDVHTAEAVLIANDGTLLINNFDTEKTAFFMEWFNRIYDAIVYFRNLDKEDTEIEISDDEILQKLEEAEENIKAGRVYTMEEVFDRLEKRHGIQT